MSHRSFLNLLWLGSRQYVPQKRRYCTHLTHHLLTYLLMEQSLSWEANRFAASQEIPRILWNPKVYYRIHKCPSHVAILSQFNPIHIPISNFLKIRLNIILPSTPGSTKSTTPHGVIFNDSNSQSLLWRPKNSQGIIDRRLGSKVRLFQ
jgi:hypothetical protein